MNLGSVIHFNCQSCGSVLTVPMEMAGVTGPCPYCRATITSPHATPPPAAAAANPFTAPMQSMGHAVPGPAQSPMAHSAPVHSAYQSPQPQYQQVPAAGQWSQGPGAMPGAHPSAQASAMTGATWPPSPNVVRGSGAHPVMERLLHAPNPLPATTPPYQERTNTPPRRRSSSGSSREGGQRGAMWVALLMAVLVLFGTSWFFRDQLKAAWLSHTIKDDEPAARTPAATPAFEPKPEPSLAPPEGKVPIVHPPIPPPPTPPPTSAASGSETILRPAIPAVPGAPKIPDPPKVKDDGGTGGLVEVPGAASPGPPVNVPPTAPPVPPVIDGETPATQPALDALLEFFHAKTWQDRLPLVQAPNSMKPLMEQYYATNPDSALYPSHIQVRRFDNDPETGPPHCVFQVTGGGLRQPLPVMVENTKNGWKVDWLTFTEFKDDLLLKFLESPQPEPARFHVLMRRAHYFENDVPALDKKACFQVMPPVSGFTGDVFALKGAPVMRELDTHLGWEVTQGAAVVELQWRQEDRYQWVELTNLVQLNWRNVEPAAPKAVPVK